MGATDVPGPRRWRCCMANEQTNWGRGEGEPPKSPFLGLKGVIFFFPPWENINCCFINSCHFLTYKDSQSFPFVYFDDLWNKLQPKVSKKNFHVRFSERGLCYHNVLSAGGLLRLAPAQAQVCRAFFPAPPWAAWAVCLTSLKAMCWKPKFSVGQTLL